MTSPRKVWAKKQERDKKRSAKLDKELQGLFEEREKEKQKTQRELEKWKEESEKAQKEMWE